MQPYDIPGHSNFNAAYSPVNIFIAADNIAHHTGPFPLGNVGHNKVPFLLCMANDLAGIKIQIGHARIPPKEKQPAD